MINNTFDYIRGLYPDVLELFPDPYLFLGGDEVGTGCWGANKRIVAWMKAHNISLAAMQSYFEHKLIAIARNVMGKDVIVRQEVYNRATDPVGTLGLHAVVDVWKGSDYGLVKNVTASGLRAVLAGCRYLDIISGETAWGREWVSCYKCDPRVFVGSRAFQYSPPF